MNKNALALLMTAVAGLATVLGGFLALLLRHQIKPVPLAGALGFAGGVMLFVSFVEIYFEGLSQLKIALEPKFHGHSDRKEAVAGALGMSLFLAGWFLASIFDGLMHIALDAHSARGLKKQDAVVQTASTLPELVSFSEPESNAMHKCHSGDCSGIENPPKENLWHLLMRYRLVRALLGVQEISREDKIRADARFRADFCKIRRLGYFTALVLALHNFPEGFAAFTGAAADTKFGLGLALAIGIHNIPEGIAVAVPILFGTGSKMKAMVYTLISGVAEPIGGLIAWAVFGNDPHPWAFGTFFFITAGIMVNVALKELLFTALRYDVGNQITFLAFMSGMVVMAISLTTLDLFI